MHSVRRRLGAACRGGDTLVVTKARSPRPVAAGHARDPRRPDRLACVKICGGGLCRHSADVATGPGGLAAPLRARPVSKSTATRRAHGELCRKARRRRCSRLRRCDRSFRARRVRLPGAHRRRQLAATPPRSHDHGLPRLHARSRFALTVGHVPRGKDQPPIVCGWRAEN
jgi:hypothetical protein